MLWTAWGAGADMAVLASVSLLDLGEIFFHLL